MIFQRNNVNSNFSKKINLFTPMKEKNIDFSPSAPPYYE